MDPVAFKVRGDASGVQRDLVLIVSEFEKRYKAGDEDRGFDEFVRLDAEQFHPFEVGRAQCEDVDLDGGETIRRSTDNLAHPKAVCKVDEHVARLRFLASHVETDDNDMLDMPTFGKIILVC